MPSVEKKGDRVEVTLNRGNARWCHTGDWNSVVEWLKNAERSGNWRAEAREAGVMLRDSGRTR